MRAPRHPRHGQQGALLIVTLIMLTVLTMIGVSAMRATVLEEKMAGNARDRSIAFQAAEAALRDGEADVQISLSETSPFSPACTNGLCLPSATATPVWKDTAKVDWNASTNVVAYGANSGMPALAGVSAPPAYIVELLPPVTPQGSSLVVGFKPPAAEEWFRITARGTGGTTTALVTVQSVYKK